MITDPVRRGRALADFYRAVAPRLFRDLEESGVLPDAGDPQARALAREEWECFALYACVRGLVAAGGVNRENGAAGGAPPESALGPGGGAQAAAPDFRPWGGGRAGAAGGR